MCKICGWGNFGKSEGGLVEESPESGGQHEIS